MHIHANGSDHCLALMFVPGLLRAAEQGQFAPEQLVLLQSKPDNPLLCPTCLIYLLGFELEQPY